MKNGFGKQTSIAIVLALTSASFTIPPAQAQNFDALIQSAIQAGVKSLQNGQNRPNAPVYEAVAGNAPVPELTDYSAPGSSPKNPLSQSSGDFSKAIEDHLSCRKFLLNDAQKNALRAEKIIGSKGTVGVQGSEVYKPLRPVSVFGIPVKSFSFFGQETEQMAWVTLNSDLTTSANTLKRAGLRLVKNGNYGYETKAKNNLQVSVTKADGEVNLSCEVVNIN